MSKITLSTLPKTWLIDIDGVVFYHNSHLESGDKIIPTFKKFIDNLNKDDVVILLTARESKYKKGTIESLKNNGIRYNYIIFDLPKGERIVINDSKPHGMITAVAISTERDLANIPTLEYSEDI